MKLQIEQIPLDLSPLDLFLKVSPSVKNLSFLSSDDTENSRWSILSWDPSSIISYDGSDAFLNGKKQADAFHSLISKILRSRRISANELFPFLGGAICSIDYEYGYELLGIPKNINKPDLRKLRKNQYRGK